LGRPKRRSSSSAVAVSGSTARVTMNRRGTDLDRPVVIERSIFTLTPTDGTRPGVPFVLTPFAPRLAARHDVYLPDAANPPDIANAVILPCSDTPGARRCNGFG
jgi:hypothetical protein